MSRLAERALAEATDRVVLARDAYTYGHVPIVAGIILTAIGNELVIAHPTDELSEAELVAVVTGPALFLLAQAWLRRRMTGGISARRLAGVVACGAVGLVDIAFDALVVAALLVAVLVAIAVADGIAAGRRTRA